MLEKSSAQGAVMCVIWGMISINNRKCLILVRPDFVSGNLAWLYEYQDV